MLEINPERLVILKETRPASEEYSYHPWDLDSLPKELVEARNTYLDAEAKLRAFGTDPRYFDNNGRAIAPNVTDYYDELFANIKAAENAFYEHPANPLKEIPAKDDFAPEAENLKKWAEAQGVKVDIVEPYGDREQFINAINTLKETDEVAIMAHSGSKLFGINVDEFTELLSNTEARNIYMGVCEMPFDDIVSAPDKNLFYETDKWYGFSQKGKDTGDYQKDLISRFFAREDNGKRVTLVDPIEGKHYTTYSTPAKREPIAPIEPIPNKTFELE